MSSEPARVIERLTSPVTLRQAALAHLREAIVSGVLAPGSSINEGQLSRQMGLSVTPLREALMQLSAEGLIVIEPNKQKRVAPQEPEAIVELLEVQNQLWSLGYAWGAPKIGRDELKRLRSIFTDHERATDAKNPDAAVRAAHAFHLVFMQATGNRELVRVSTDRLAFVRRFVLLCAPWMPSPQALTIHRKMLKALACGDIARVLNLRAEAAEQLLGAARALCDRAKSA